MAEDSSEFVRANEITNRIINEIIEGGADATLVGNVLRSLPIYRPAQNEACRYICSDGEKSCGGSFPHGNSPKGS